MFFSLHTRNIVLLCFLVGFSSSIDAFGHSLLPLFSLDPTYLNINHGSYGSAPKYVHSKLQEYQLLAEANPDRWFRLDIQVRMNELRKRLSSYVNCDADDLVLIDNASAGVNSLLKSLKFKENETILYYSVAYGMVKLTLEYVSEEIFTEEQIIQIDLDHQTIQDTNLLLKKTQETLNRVKNVRLIVFDHISSTPAVRFEIEKMIQYFRRQKILTLIDGAHAVGAIPLDLKSIDPDFYLSNNHKWLFAHRTSCFLYVRRELQSLIHPIITSFGYEQRTFQSEFFWLGTKDYSAFLTIADALDFRQMIGNESSIFSYTHELARQAGDLLSHLWNTSTLTEDEKFITTMNNIQLPAKINTTERMNFLYQKLITDENIFLPMFPFDQKFYCRISAQIYTELVDYRTVGQLVLKIIEEIL